jgi:tetratricopeptide (TPR) repeat protein
LQENSTGEHFLKACLKPLLVLLLAAPLLGQQEHDTTLESLLETAHQAQSSSDYTTAANAYKQAVKMRPDVPELWANLGLMEHETADYTGAIQSFQHAYRLKPSLYVPNLFLGIDFVHVGKAKEAIPFLLTAEKMNDADSQPHLALGRAYSSLQEFSLAAHEFTHVTQLDPKQSAAWFSLGIAYLDQVEADARKMADVGHDSSYAKALYAGSLATQARYVEAGDVYKGVLGTNPQPPCVQGELGLVYLKQHDSASAAREFTASCSLALLGQARLQIDAGANADALHLLQQLWTRDEGFLETNLSRLTDGLSAERSAGFIAFLAQQQTADSLSKLLTAALQGMPFSSDQESIAGSRGNPEKDYELGHYRLCASQAESSLNTKDRSQLQLLAACSFLTGDYLLASHAAGALTQSPEALYWSIQANEKLAFQALERYEELEPHSARTHLLLGDIYVQRERYEDALVEYQKALDLSPDDPAALLGLASAYLRNGNTEKAIETGQLALKRSPDDPEINLLMGEALVAHHQFPNAEPFLKKGLNSKPQMLPHVHALLGRVYAESGQTQEALAELKAGLESDGDGSVHYQLARIYRQMGDTKDANAAIEAMKAIQQRRRDGAVIAFKDSHSSSLDDEP